MNDVTEIPDRNSHREGTGIGFKLRFLGLSQRRIENGYHSHCELSFRLSHGI